MKRLLLSVVSCGLVAAGGGVVAQEASRTPREVMPAPVSEYRGMQEREEAFEFTKKPEVRMQNAENGREAWVITFASKGACDATVSVLDKDGRIVRHLASGVLGKNAPHPFQQDSLSQTIGWDGLSDDFNPAPSGCSARVSLGLQARYDKSIGYDPATVPDPKSVLIGTGPDGLVYVSANAPRWDVNCVAFDKDGKYVKTVLPPPAAEMEKAAPALGCKLSTTKWGDKVLVCDWFGPFSSLKAEVVVPKLVPGVSLAAGSAPTNLQSSKATGVGAWAGKLPHLAADRARDEIYAGTGGQTRFIGKTGELDKTWFPDPKTGLTGNSSTCEVSVGVDGLIYLRFGGSNYGRHMIRLDHEGKPVPFKKEDTVNVPGGNAWWERLPAAFKNGIDAVYCGVAGHSMTHQSGLYAAPNGMIVMGIHEVAAKWAAEQGIIKPEENKGGEIKGNYNPVFDSDGKLLSANPVGETSMGQGVTMDRDGNIYTVFGGVTPAGQPRMDGSDLSAPLYRQQGGSGTLVKFRGQGGKFPLNQGEAKVKLSRGKPFDVPGALWAYGGITGQSSGDCQCHHQRFDMDFFARSFIPSAQLCSVTVLDANGNRIARFGRYGNVDDGEADLKSGKGDAIRIAWMRAVAASDVALYVVDPANRRILRAALSYSAEETVALK